MSERFLSNRPAQGQEIIAVLRQDYETIDILTRISYKLGTFSKTGKGVLSVLRDPIAICSLVLLLFAGASLRADINHDFATLGKLHQHATSSAKAAQFGRLTAADAEAAKRSARAGIDLIGSMEDQIAGQLQKLEAGPAQFELLRAEILSGSPQRAQEIFTLHAMALSLAKWWLWLADAHAALGGKTLAYGDYQLIRDRITRGWENFHASFGTFPPFPHGKINRSGEWQPIREKTEPILRYFSQNDSPTESETAFVFGLLGLANDATTSVQNYQTRFPTHFHEDALAAEAAAVNQIPGSEDCLRLGSGVSHFPWSPCQPKAFREGISRLIELYTRHDGVNVRRFLLNEVAQAKTHDEDSLTADPKKYWQKKSETLTRTTLPAVLRITPAEARQKWQPILNAFFSELIANPELINQGLPLARALRQILDAHGVDTGVGFEEDHAPLIDAAKTARDSLERSFRLKEGGRIPEMIYRPDASLDSCPLVETKPKDESPWVVVAEQEITSLGLSEESTASARRLSRSYQVRVGDFHSVQVRHAAAARLFAGIAEHTALSMIVPTIVSTRLLLNLPVGESLSSLGIKVGDAADELALAQAPATAGGYALASWETIIDEAKRAHHLQRALFRLSSAEKQFDLHSSEQETPDDFVAVFRQKTLAAAQELRRIRDALSKYSDVSRIALESPTVASVINLPPDITEEHPVNGRRNGGLNLSLIREFLPTLIYEYIHAYPHAGAYSAKGKSEAATKALYRELHDEGKFTIEQMRSVLDWYLFGPAHRPGKLTNGGETPPAPFSLPGSFSLTRTPVCEGETLKLLYTQPLLMQRLVEHAQSIHAKPVLYLQYAQKRLEYTFPALRLNDAYMKYDDNQFEAHLVAFLENAVGEANRVANLRFSARANADWIRRSLNDGKELVLPWLSVKDPLGYFIPLQPILDRILRIHPDFKWVVCQEQRAMGFTQAVADNLLSTLGTAAAIAAYADPTRLTWVGLGTAVAYVQMGRAYREAQEVERAERLALAGATQIGEEENSLNRAYLAQMEWETAIATGRAIVEVALITPGVFRAWPKLAQLPGRFARSMSQLGSSVARGWSAEAKVQAAGGMWFQRLPGPLSQSMSFIHRGRHALMRPFVEIGLLERISLRELGARFARDLSWKTFWRLPFRTALQGLHYYIGRYALPFGYQIGGGRAAQLFAYYLYAEAAAAGVEVWEHGSEERALSKALLRRAESSGNYREYLEAQYNGEFTESEFALICEIDEELNQLYSEQVRGLQDQARKQLDAQTRAKLLLRSQELLHELVNAIETEQNSPQPDPNRLMALQKQRREVAALLVDF